MNVLKSKIEKKTIIPSKQFIISFTYPKGVYATFFRINSIIKIPVNI